MPRVSRLSQEQRRQAALSRSRARYERNASQIRTRNSQHIANVCVWDMDAHAIRREDPEERRREQLRNTAEHSTRRTIPEFRIPERIRDMDAHAIRREDPEERRREQVRNTAEHASRRTNPEFRISERIRDAAARAAHREDLEERAREQERNTEDHRQRRRDSEDRQRERERDANNRRATRRNPIARTQEQRINTSQRRETRQQRRIWEEQIRQMAEDRLINFSRNATKAVATQYGRKSSTFGGRTGSGTRTTAK
ncbi:uncharacterized protein [Drosophila bipectinata]|uniref:uncharacterized protein n=1 Tax=Drosophila bipectinata TaxID=42026 RepID=UPI0038B411CF